MEYTTLSFAQVQAGLEAVAADTQSAFGALDARQLNWRPDATRWSVAQCFEHLLTANRLMVEAAQGALDGKPRSIWQRLPVLPGVFGRMLIRSQAPQSTRKFTASPLATPAASEIAPDILQRFIAQNHELVRWLRGMDESRAAGVVMTSPFVSFIVYSVLDGARLLLAHDHRHVEQARRVMQAPGFPS
jgi:DinB family protein